MSVGSKRQGKQVHNRWQLGQVLQQTQRAQWAGQAAIGMGRNGVVGGWHLHKRKGRGSMQQWHLQQAQAQMGVKDREARGSCNEHKGQLGRGRRTKGDECEGWEARQARAAPATSKKGRAQGPVGEGKVLRRWHLGTSLCTSTVSPCNMQYDPDLWRKMVVAFQDCYCPVDLRQRLMMQAHQNPIASPLMQLRAAQRAEESSTELVPIPKPIQRPGYAEASNNNSGVPVTQSLQHCNRDNDNSRAPIQVPQTLQHGRHSRSHSRSPSPSNKTAIGGSKVCLVATPTFKQREAVQDLEKQMETLNKQLSALSERFKIISSEEKLAMALKKLEEAEKAAIFNKRKAKAAEDQSKKIKEHAEGQLEKIRRELAEKEEALRWDMAVRESMVKVVIEREREGNACNAETRGMSRADRVAETEMEVDVDMEKPSYAAQGTSKGKGVAVQVKEEEEQGDDEMEATHHIPIRNALLTAPTNKPWCKENGRAKARRVHTIFQKDFGVPQASDVEDDKSAVKGDHGRNSQETRTSPPGSLGFLSGEAEAITKFVKLILQGQDILDTPRPSPKKTPKCRLGNFQMIGIANDVDIVNHEAAEEDVHAVDAFEQHNTDTEPQFTTWMIKNGFITEELREEAEDNFRTCVSHLAGLIRKNTPWKGETNAAFKKRITDTGSKEAKRARKNTRQNTKIQKMIAEELRGDLKEDEAWGKIEEAATFLVLWRSTEITKLLKFVNADGKRMGAEGGPRPGNRGLVCKRVRRPVLQRMAKAGLPINFYNQTWYWGLSTEVKKFLGATAYHRVPVLMVVQN
ncbi:hypothetical protein FA15DRAFT_660583 [Coprinopsis marcescibilis]|uniref:Uncharacterized protein n=1 Tax=Coprinopsis marcescibilis TaxID=230819 RepID=A0A5C3KF43_COPMA|nr:hypothetical protein FA15DRAFT_660583 [Coprinopsis marcescibilis]